MPGRVVVREEETLREALRKFKIEVDQATRRQWSKTRPGHYVKPSDRRRLKAALQARNHRSASRGRKGYSTIYLSPRQLFRRELHFSVPKKQQRRHSGKCVNRPKDQ